MLAMVRVSARPVADDEKTADGSYEIAVEDNGIGFDEQYSQQIFEPFKRLHSSAEYPGSGIGLAVCKTICDRHGWKISVQSTQGRGTTFTVIVPALEQESLSEAAA